MRLTSKVGLAALIAGMVSASALAVVVPVTSFETNRDGETLAVGNPAGYDSLQEVMLHDPSWADTTVGFIIAKDNWDAVGGCPTCQLPEDSLEESYVEYIFGGSAGTSQSVVSFWSWADPTDASRWARITTKHPPDFPSPAVHLSGKVKMKLRIRDFGFGASNLNLAFGLLIRETDTTMPLGFNGGITGPLEFVGISNLLDADSNGPTPVADPAYSFTGPTSSGDNNFVDLIFDLSTLTPHGWTAMGGDGTLSSATGRGALEALVVIPTESGPLKRDVMILIDEVVFEAPVNDPVIEPRLGLPIIEGATQVRVNDVLTSSTNVALEVDRAYDGVTFVADQTYNKPLTGTQTIYYVNVTGISPGLAIGDAVRARQTNPSGTGPYTPITEVTGPPEFTLTLSLDEDGNGSMVVADFEYVGATTVIGTAAPQGKAVFPQCGVWQNVEFSLIPGVEPVISFAGGDGNLNPDGGLYSIDALFFSINTIDPHAGPYDVFLDHLYIIDAANNEVVLSDVETANPFPSRRYNPPDPAWYSTIISGLASYDGRYSNRIQWEFNNANTDNSYAAYRLYPGWPFADTAKAFGLWLLVEDCATNGPPRPSLAGAIIGDAPAITVDDLDPAATAVQLYVNGSPDTEILNPGVTTIDIAPTATLALLDQVTATQTTAALGESAPSRPRVVSTPLAPAVEGPIVPGESSVTVSGLMTDANATASTVTVYIDGGSPSTAPGGTETVVVSTPTLNDGEAITATQIVNGLESAESAAVIVAVPPPTVQAPLDMGDTLVTVNDLHPTATTVTVHVNATTYPQATGGASTVVVTVPALNPGDAVKATQTIAGAVGPFSNTVVVANYVVINEFAYDDAGTDNHQFIELHNFGGVPIDISGWKIEVGDYETAIDPYVYYTITIPASTTIAAGGYWTVGQPNVATQIPGAIVDMTDTTRMDDGMSYLALRNPGGVMLDAVGWETNKGYVFGPPEAEADIYAQIGTGIWGNHVHPDDPATSQSRWLDGLDTDNNGRDFGIQIATPGFTNNQSDLMPYSENANALTPPASVANWVFSYMPLRAIDPATADTLNPSAIPASPDGGNVMIGWDETGGGNACYMSQLAKEDFTLETYIYIPPTYSPVGWGYEETRIGVRGMTCGVHNFGYYNGSTGVCWFWQRGESWQILWLFDENDGGDDDWPAPYSYARYLGGIGIAENDPDTTGWQRLLLETSGDKVRGIFGGTYGSRGNGMKFSGTHDAPGPGGIYVSYREAMTGTGVPDNRPPTLDAFTLTDPPLDGDMDLDDDVDLDDLVKFIACMSGPDVDTPPGGCTLNEFGLADLQWDNDVDLGDFAEFQVVFP